MAVLQVSEDKVYHSCRAKYIPGENGELRLAKIQKFSCRKFKEDGFERLEKLSSVDKLKLTDIIDEESNESFSDVKGDPSDILRAIKRAQINAFDYILSNPDLDTFATFTYSPESVNDKADYDECYKKLSIWLSNRVQRRGLKYVITPEYTKRGDIHFHAICNSAALKLVEAVNPKNGRLLRHNGKQLYNLTDWNFGFTSAELIGNTLGDREAVAKYVFKYMRKQMGQKIGGRYCLTGGNLKKPVYVFGEAPEVFFDGSECKYDKHIDLECCGISYDEWSFIYSSVYSL